MKLHLIGSIYTRTIEIIDLVKKISFFLNECWNQNIAAKADQYHGFDSLCRQVTSSHAVDHVE